MAATSPASTTASPTPARPPALAATFHFSYFGPTFNTPGQPLTTSEQALAQVFAWFNSVGGIDNTDLLQLVNLPGGGLIVADGIGSTYADEITIGGVRNFGARGSVRADLVYRAFGNFYVTQKDTATGQVTNANGDTVDLGIVRNDDGDLEREYIGLQTSFDFRASDRLTIGGGYSLSNASGNFEGESPGVGPVTSTLESYPEYKEARWFAPQGDLLIDQRHKLSLFAVWEAFKTDRQRLSVSARQLYNSGFAVLGGRTGRHPCVRDQPRLPDAALVGELLLLRPRRLQNGRHQLDRAGFQLLALLRPVRGLRAARHPERVQRGRRHPRQPGRPHQPQRSDPAAVQSLHRDAPSRACTGARARTSARRLRSTTCSLPRTYVFSLGLRF